MLDHASGVGPLQIDAALRAAVRAPSSHNTQPWAFAIEPGAIRLYADRMRALPVNDPDDRELTISCGAALFNLLLALRTPGAAPAATLLPDDADPDLLAIVRLHGGEPAGPGDIRLADAIDKRHTCRAGFQDRALPDVLLAELTTAASGHGALLELVDAPPRRHQLARLVGEGDRMQWADPHWRGELAAWMHPRRRRDGLVTHPLLAPLEHATIAAFDLGPRIGERDEHDAGAAPALAILATASDEPHDWLTAGMALEHVLLRAAADGARAAYLNQPVQVAALRPEVATLLDCAWLPQVVLRLGFPVRGPEYSLRRPVANVIVGTASPSGH